jgi:hypothetical protein
MLKKGELPSVEEELGETGPLSEGAKPELPKGHDFPQVFTVRWTGFVEPRFTEPYVFSLYYEKAELWLGGKRIELRDLTGRGDKFWTDPIRLEAGRLVPIRLVWHATKGMDSEAHLNWQSPTQAIEHVPTSALYPTD